MPHVKTVDPSVIVRGQGARQKIGGRSRFVRIVVANDDHGEPTPRLDDKEGAVIGGQTVSGNLEDGLVIAGPLQGRLDGHVALFPGGQR